MRLVEVYNDKYFLGNVGVVSQFGSEQTILQAARICRGVHPWEAPQFSEERNQALLRILMKNKHHRPFEFAGIIFFFKAPIFVERQMRTYRKPDIERSLRACGLCEPAFATCELPASEMDDESLLLEEAHTRALGEYNRLLELGAKNEEARRVLPVDTLTEWLSYFTVRSLFHFFEERLHPSAQSETRLFAQKMYDLVQSCFPNVFIKEDKEEVEEAKEVEK